MCGSSLNPPACEKGLSQTFRGRNSLSLARSPVPRNVNYHREEEEGGKDPQEENFHLLTQGKVAFAAHLSKFFVSLKYVEPLIWLLS